MIEWIFPDWPTPQELRYLPKPERRQWWALAALQFTGLMLGITLIFFG